MKIGRYLFDRYGGRVVFFGRFVSILRTYAAFLAGTNRMRWRHFLVCNAAGGILWSAIYTFASYAAGSTMHRFSGVANIILGVVAVTVILATILVVRRQASRLAAVAEAAYPGELT